MRGFNESSNVFELATTHGYGQKHDPARMRWFRRVRTLCRDLEPGVDDGYLSETEPFNERLTHIFPEVGPARMMQGICINGAQLASATNSAVDHPKYEMSTR